MFGFGKKSRAAEAIRRGVQASFTGAYLHPSEIEQLHLNKNASSWLYTEALAHHIYALGYISATALKAEKWATLDFFFGSAIDGMRDSEKNNGPSAEQIAPVVLKRYGEFEAFSGQDRVNDAHYYSSAELVSKQDSSANKGQIAQMLKFSTEKFVADARKMFGV